MRDKDKLCLDGPLFGLIAWNIQRQQTVASAADTLAVPSQSRPIG